MLTSIKQTAGIVRYAIGGAAWGSAAERRLQRLPGAPELEGKTVR